MTLPASFPRPQFRRVANIYFLFHAIVSLTSVSPVAPWTTWPALLMVLGFSLAKEGIEDYRRHKQDKQNNLSTVHRVITADPENKATGLLSICRPWRFQLGHGHKSTSAVAPVDYSANEAIYWQDIRVRRLSLHCLTLVAHIKYTSLARCVKEGFPQPNTCHSASFYFKSPLCLASKS